MDDKNVDYIEFFSHGFCYKKHFYHYADMSNIEFQNRYDTYKNVLLISFTRVNIPRSIDFSDKIDAIHRKFIFADNLEKDGIAVKTMLGNWDNYCRNTTNSNQEILELKHEIGELKQEIGELIQRVKDLMYAPSMPGYVSSHIDFANRNETI
jgi:HAMP domain-containing protein